MRVRFVNGREAEVRDEIAERMVAKGQCTVVERNVTPEPPAVSEALPVAGGIQPDKPWPKPAAHPAKGRRK